MENDNKPMKNVETSALFCFVFVFGFGFIF